MDLSNALVQLELEPTATGEEASKAYKDLIKVWHPDNFTAKPDLLARATAKTKLLNEAWKTVLALQDRPARPTRLAKRPLPVWVPPAAVFLVTLLVLGSLAGLAVVSDLFNPALRLEKALAERAYFTNRHLPLALDADTSLTAVFSGPGRKFTYVYQVMNYTKDQVGQAYFDVVREGLKKNFQSELRRDRDLKFFYSNDIVLDYSFKDKNGADILTLEVKPEAYKTY